MQVNQIRKSAVSEEIDYLFLQDKLKEYAYPRDKITSLLNSKALIRVKKGLYVFGEDLAKEPYCKETLANLIYGPSAISLEYALSFYGMIPERVVTITSITNQRDKVFHTPIGNFTYKYINPIRYPVGITQIKLNNIHSILIATREKALADMLTLYKLHFNNEQELQEYLFDNLRIDEEQIFSLNKTGLSRLATVYDNNNVDLLISLLRKKK
jgi:predicted transcriptional regulator of viral defense system